VGTAILNARHSSIVPMKARNDITIAPLTCDEPVNE
jgi:hypothetical protein